MEKQNTPFETHGPFIINENAASVWIQVVLASLEGTAGSMAQETGMKAIDAADAVLDAYMVRSAVGKKIKDANKSGIVTMKGSG